MTCFKTFRNLAVAAFFSGFFMISCQDEKAEFEDFRAFDGMWILDDAGRDYVESWHVDGDRWEGVAVERSDMDTAFHEEMTIFHRGEDGWVLGVTMADETNSSTVFFRLMEYKPGYFSFENKTHDFPKRIIYSFPDTDRMEAIVDDGPDGDKSLEFKLRREKSE